ncbi:NAD(P)-dependent alcohol dehydrogenase [Agrococcus sp. HG114]|uniref:NAD(P)-dependent alcohol dehydrogenase n=1 Tax=Agrococcus sp. HG114 TaxID=2969757 RepID=UPI00215B6F78|nr:NAD(P)-dependent alcohol dehydrogenase [Agrococcus sp. HG114]MCR8669824.1 NAD(P)-dependent alcohol dehydrogenase [Agrococcus sp. HG114]
MRAVVVERYGPPEVARVVEVADASPGKGEVVVRVRAAAVTAGDARVRGAAFPAGMRWGARLALGIRKPRRAILGMSFSGVVDALGEGVTAFAVGDEVSGTTGARFGAHAELVAVAAERLVPKPAGVSHEAAAAVLFGGLTALHFLDAVGLAAGRSVLVVGASGAVGSSAVQLARIAGARVTGVTSGRNAGLVRALGAERVVDYEREDVTALDDRFDVILDTVGTLSARTGRPLLREGGTLVLIAGGLRDMLSARGDVKTGVAGEKPEHMRRLLALLDARELDPVLQETIPLAEIARAYEIVDSHRKIGNVVVVP